MADCTVQFFVLNEHKSSKGGRVVGCLGKGFHPRLVPTQPLTSEAPALATYPIPPVLELGSGLNVRLMDKAQPVASLHRAHQGCTIKPTRLLRTRHALYLRFLCPLLCSFVCFCCICWLLSFFTHFSHFKNSVQFILTLVKFIFPVYLRYFCLNQKRNRWFGDKVVFHCWKEPMHDLVLLSKCRSGNFAMLNYRNTGPGLG